MLLTLVLAVGLVAFVSIRPGQPWILWLVVLLAGLAADGIVRSHRAWNNTGLSSTAAFAALPALGALGAGLFIDEALTGYARPVSALGAALAIGGATAVEFATVDFEAKRYHFFRLLLAIATYVAAFTLFTVIVARVGLIPGAILIGAVSHILTLELLRENRLFSLEALLLGAAVGASMAELRLALYFFPLDSLLTGALLIIGFYLATGLVHHLLDHDLEWGTAFEYLSVAAAGTAAVVVTRVVV